jgi:8-oxo-dGTP pyrophosphatase MutT (NUDIX family)
VKLRPRAEVISIKGNKVLAGIASGGYVVFPGGGIDPGESAVHAAKRECLEEADRALINCTVAHPPTVQLWPKDYKPAWAEGYDGGLTYWMTGSTSDTPFHVDPRNRHADYEDSIRWRPIDEVLQRLKHDITGDWADDVKVRLSVLETHLKMNMVHEKTGAVTPRLHALRSA